MNITAIPALKDNYIWAFSMGAQDAWVVDPGEAEPVRHFLENTHLHLKGILITHHHWDHTGGVSQLKQWYEVPVYGPHNSPFPEITHPLIADSVLSLSHHGPHFTILSIPGHTLDHIAYYTDNHLFCGDTLFACGCGRVFEGSMEQMHHALQTLAALPPTTQLYCAHEYTLANLRFAKMVEPNNSAIVDRLQQVKHLRDQGLPSLPSVLAEELQTNPFLRCDAPAVKAAVSKKAGRALEEEMEVFTELRNWKDCF